MSPDPLHEFFRTYDQSVYSVMAGGRGAPSQARFQAFENDLGFEFPTDFRAFTLSPLGGLCIEVREQHWPRPKASAKPSTKDLFGLKIFGLAAPIPDFLDLREEIFRLPEHEGDLIPFMGLVGVEDRYCYDLDGQILLWSAKDGQREIVPLGFTDLALRELAALEQRRIQLGRSVTQRRGKKASSS